MPSKNGQTLNNGMDIIAVNKFTQALNQGFSSRSDYFRRLLDPRRDIDEECGYPDTRELNWELYQEMFDRNPIAARAVEVLPKESWQTFPEIYEDEDEDPDSETQFEGVLHDDLPGMLRGTSFYEGEEGNPIWDLMLRADIQSGIGDYGIILLGLDGQEGEELRDPAEGIDEFGRMTKARPTDRELLYIRTFPESLARVTAYERDPLNPRFGLPTRYFVTFNTFQYPSTGLPSGAVSQIGMSVATFDIHWSRVIHLADNLGSNETFGVSRQKAIYNNLLNLIKIYGASGEGYWKAAVMALSLETHPQLGGDVQIDQKAIQDMMWSFGNSMQKYISLSGMSAKPLAPSIVDPTPHVDAQIDAICVKLGIPKRVFMGSERGELASSQDDAAWNDRLRHRQNMYLTPRVLVPFIDRLICLGVLPQPEKYKIRWPDLNALSDDEKATVAQKRMATLGMYVQQRIEQILPPIHMYTEFLGMEPKQAEQIIDDAMDTLPEDNMDTMTLPDPSAGQQFDDQGNPVDPNEEEGGDENEPRPTDNAWSDEAREAALEARKAKGKADHAESKGDYRGAAKFHQRAGDAYSRAEGLSRTAGHQDKAEHYANRATHHLEKAERYRAEALRGQLIHHEEAGGNEQPIGNEKDELGHGSDKQGEGGPSKDGKHGVVLPKNPKKMTIQHAATALHQMGYKLGAPVPWQQDKPTRYNIVHPNGSKSVSSIDEIHTIVYRGQRAGASQKIKRQTENEKDVLGHGSDKQGEGLHPSSKVEIDRWKKIVEKQGQAGKERLSRYLASKALGRDFGASVESHLATKGLTQFHEWALGVIHEGK